MLTWSEFKRNEKNDFWCFQNADHTLHSEMFSVRINSQDIPVYSCRISKYPFNRGWPGFQRPIDQTVQASFINLIGDECLNFSIISKYKFEKAYIKPYSSKTTLNVTKGTISFRIEKNGFYVLELDDHKHLLYIFYNKPCNEYDESQITHYYGSGVRFVGRVELKSNDRVYIDKDCYLFGSFYSKDTKNIEIFGNGVIDNSIEERAVSEFFDEYPTGNATFVNCNGLHISGIGLINADCWCVKIIQCINVIVSGIKIFGQWRYNTDGVDIVNSQHIRLYNNFIHSFDDTIAIKGWPMYSNANSNDIRIENCVLWCDWGRALEIGLETYCTEIYEVAVRNVDILRPGLVALDISNGDYAEIHHITFENINIEVDKNHLPEVFQRTDDQIYDKEKETIEPYILNVNNRRYPKFKVNGIECETPVCEKDAYSVHDIIYKNININYYCSENVDGKYNLKLGIKSYVNTVNFNNLKVENLTVNGKRTTEDNFNLETDLSGEFHFE